MSRLEEHIIKPITHTYMAYDWEKKNNPHPYALFMSTFISFMARRAAGIIERRGPI